MLFTEPVRQLAAHTPGEVEPLLRDLDAALADGFHVAGMLSYEAGHALDASLAPPPADPAVPLAWFGIYATPTVLDAADVASCFDGLEAPAVRDIAFAWTRSDYTRAVASVRESIRAGDVYQINLTAPFDFRLDGAPLALYSALRSRQSAAYGAYATLHDAHVLSVSPELFFRVDSDGPSRRITARPMKGTAGRGESAEADAALVDTLLSNPKDRAENLMIVDLLRNDLARVAETGSVRVPALFEAERYETVTQLTSTVAADLRSEVGVAEAMRALFPCGSVTGAPKLRAMEIIGEVETRPRGVYCGAIGYASPCARGLGEAVFNVAIRTAVVDASGSGRYDVGSGIVWDSEPDAEYAECLLKARVLTDLV